MKKLTAQMPRNRPVLGTRAFASLAGLVGWTFMIIAPCFAIEHYPTIPDFLKSSRVTAILQHQNCEPLRDHIASSNGIAFVQPAIADLFLVITDAAKPLLPNMFPSSTALRAKVRGRPGAGCDFGGNFHGKQNTIYIFQTQHDGTLHRIFYSMPSCLFGSVSNIFTGCAEPVLMAGYIMVQFRDGMTDNNRKSFLEDYGLTPFIEERSEIGIGLTLAVPAGSEEAWVTVLRHNRDVAEVTRVPEKVASLNSEGIFAADATANSGLRAPLSFSEVRKSLDQASAQTVKFFGSYFQHKGRVDLRRKDKRRITVDISGLRGEVLPTEGYWERLVIEVIFSPVEQDISFFLIITGSYASGLGARLPPDESFLDMDHKYGAPLQAYVDRLTVSLQSQFGSQK